MMRFLAAFVLIGVIIGALLWAGLRERSGEAEQPLIDQVQDALDQDAAKGRFTGELGDFAVYDLVDGRIPPEVEEQRICPATEPVTDAASVQSHELWSDALGPTGIGWACPDGGIVAVNNEGLEGRPGLLSLRRVYFLEPPVRLIWDAPVDRLELIEVEVHSSILQPPNAELENLRPEAAADDYWPFATASLAVIERYPEGDVPGIAVFVEYAGSSDEAIELARQLID